MVLAAGWTVAGQGGYRFEKPQLQEGRAADDYAADGREVVGMAAGSLERSSLASWEQHPHILLQADAWHLLFLHQAALVDSCCLCAGVQTQLSQPGYVGLPAPARAAFSRPFSQLAVPLANRAYCL